MGAYQSVTIRPAEASDIPRLEELLYQVHALHAEGRPDLFIRGKKKYTHEELQAILREPDTRPIFVAVCNDRVEGYCFCIHQSQTAASMVPVNTLYIDDLCVDEGCRGRGVATALYAHVTDYARSRGCEFITLNVWQGNGGAMAFYEKSGLTPRSITMEMKL